MILITTCAFPAMTSSQYLQMKRSPNNLTTQETSVFLSEWCLYITENVESFYNLIYHTENVIALDKHMLPNCIGHGAYNALLLEEKSSHAVGETGCVYSMVTSSQEVQTPPSWSGETEAPELNFKCHTGLNVV